MAEGFNRSIYFMLGMVVCLVSAFSFVIWSSFRANRKREAKGESFSPEGKIRW